MNPWLEERKNEETRIRWSAGSGLFFLGFGLGISLIDLISNNADFWIYPVVAIVAYATFTWYINSLYQFLTDLDSERGKTLEVQLVIGVLNLIYDLWLGFLHIFVWPYTIVRWWDKGSIRMRDHQAVMERRRLLRTPYP